MAGCPDPRVTQGVKVDFLTGFWVRVDAKTVNFRQNRQFQTILEERILKVSFGYVFLDQDLLE